MTRQRATRLLRARWHLSFVCLLAAGCAAFDDGGASRPGRLLVDDPHSRSRPAEVVVTHLDLVLRVDFDAKRLRGVAVWQIDNRAASERLHLDARGLTIEKVAISGGAASGETTFALGDDDPVLGRSLAVDIRPETRVVTIAYHTSPDAAALQWLSPAQTASGEQPFLFTQSQAILARSWIPCQDTPGVRFTYTATVSVPRGLTAVMSARQGEPIAHPEKPLATFTFDMRQPIPSYLLALAVGKLEFRALSRRCGVYAEPAVVGRAAREFADTEKMMEAAEGLFGPYRWERYDILVLPPSFPFGGMENPRLTFVTPTVLAGDRSLVELIAHELAHSWSGNLVTNATWDDFWLNEGFTVYLEHRIMEEVYGREYDDMLALLGRGKLEAEIEEMGADAADTHLKLDLAGRDPDDGMTSIAYEKGFFFLRMLEENLGRERWDAFLRRYFNTFAFQPMTTERFLDFLRARLLDGDADLERELLVGAWVYGPGLPPNAPEIRSGALMAVEAAAEKWLAGGSARELKSERWSTHEWLHFLRTLPRPLPRERLAELDTAFGLTRSGNAEILCEWFLHAIPGGHAAAVPALREFLLRVGRRKFLEPLYKALMKTPRGAALAREVYREARAGYHKIATDTIDEIVGGGSATPATSGSSP